MFYLGGFNILDIGWAGASAVYVDLRHAGTYTDRLFQLYAGRTKIGATREPTAEFARLVGQVPTRGAASPLTVIAVDEGDRDTDFGHAFTKKPYCVYRVTWPAPDNADGDLHHFDVVAGRNPGDSFDATNVLIRVPFFEGKPSYSVDLPPLPDTGDWSIAVIPRDNAEPLGNPGDEQTATIAALVYPPALIAQPNRRPFSLSIAAGVATVAFECGTPAGYP